MTVNVPTQAPAPDVTGRRSELAQALFGSLAVIKRRMLAVVPGDPGSDPSAVTWHQVEALRQLSAAGEDSPGATMNELARMQQCALSSATALADRLIKQGLAERRPDPDDRRVIRIAPTARGAATLRLFAEARREMAIEILAPLSDDELSKLVMLMGKVAAASALDPVRRAEVAHD